MFFKFHERFRDILQNIKLKIRILQFTKKYIYEFCQRIRMHMPQKQLKIIIIWFMVMLSWNDSTLLNGSSYMVLFGKIDRSISRWDWLIFFSLGQISPFQVCASRSISRLVDHFWLLNFLRMFFKLARCTNFQ